MKKRNFTILGGDRRCIELANLLKKDGNDIKIYGFNTLDLNFNTCNTLGEAIKNSNIIIGPLPMSKDSETLNTPFNSERIYLKDIEDLLTNKQTLIFGKVEKEFALNVRKKGHKIEDYFSREEMQVLNAIPTAEGAIQTAMEEMNITLNSSNAMILGYGRIGKVVAKMLKGLGANVHVEARNYGDLAWIKAYKYTPIHINELGLFLEKMDVIFNTIPTIILDEKLLKNINENCIVIELASSPGGIDLNAAEKLGIKIIKAGGLPGKVAPITAANIIKHTVYNIIEEMEE